MPVPRTIVILGASANPSRYSNMLLRRLQNREGYEAVPVNPAQAEIEGAPVHPSLDAVAAALGNPDILTLYVSPERSAALEPAILRLRPRKVIFNPGAENPPLEASLKGGRDGREDRPFPDQWSIAVKELYDETSRELVGVAASFKTMPGADFGAWTYYCYGPDNRCFQG